MVISVSLSARHANHPGRKKAKRILRRGNVMTALRGASQMMVNKVLTALLEPPRGKSCRAATGFRHVTR
jgi:hypothetical protein